MPAGTWVKLELKEPVAIAITPDEARVLIGKYAGLPSDDEPDIYDLFRLGADGEAVGECQGQLHATIVDKVLVEER
ncbi:MAG: hypothetical protein EOP62_22350 [Sphingomonadales bacterium]|nr:MAG: hypothetical protein EOP62_22350 [Sphingomonadales bacterium]